MKHLIVIASIAIVSWTGPAHSQDETPNTTPSTEEIIAGEVKKGAPTQSFSFGEFKKPARSTPPLPPSGLRCMAVVFYPRRIRNTDLRA